MELGGERKRIFGGMYLERRGKARDDFIPFSEVERGTN